MGLAGGFLCEQCVVSHTLRCDGLSYPDTHYLTPERQYSIKLGTNIGSAVMYALLQKRYSAQLLYSYCIYCSREECSVLVLM